MKPTILVVGGGKGSWEVRGRQLGTAIGARVTSAPTRADWQQADVCVLVKRGFEQFAHTAATFGVPIVWDAVDFWKQPDDNSTPLDQMVALATAYMGGIEPALTICATQAMADALGGVYLSHHSRPRLAPAPLRAKGLVVGYEGTPKYLGPWRPAIEQVCARRGWSFVVNPVDLRMADIVVAFRGGVWDGPICRAWKSGVKYVNAIVAGRPVLTQSSAAFSELRPVGQTIEHVDELEDALVAWSDPSRRAEALEAGARRRDEFSLATVSRRYRQILAQKVAVAA